MKKTSTYRLPKLICLCLVITTFVEAFAAEPAPTTSYSNDAQVYLNHWFLIDSKESANVELAELSEETKKRKSKLSFTSDDGQSVNGILAFPTQTKAAKLALLLHPMGIDQQFWWSDKSPLKANQLTQDLLAQGFIVLTLDARLHGKRSRAGFGPRDLIQRAHSDEPRTYIDTIIGSVRDYRIALKWAIENYQPEEVLVMGYSMGAQMSLLLAAFEPSVDRVVAMVPPFVDSPSSPVAPRIHGHRIKSAQVLWLAGEKDPHSSKEKTQIAFDKIVSEDKSLVWFDSGHRLPPNFIGTVQNFLMSSTIEVAQ